MINTHKLIKNIDSFVIYLNKKLTHSLATDKVGMSAYMLQVQVFNNLKEIIERSIDNKIDENKLEEILIQNHDDMGEYDYSNAKKQIMELIKGEASISGKEGV